MRAPLLLGLMLLGGPVASQAGPPVFRFSAARSGAGTVLHYAKSNIDGSNASRIALFRAAPDRLEAFKFTPGDTRATLVIATLDTLRMTVRRFESLRLYPDGRREAVAAMEAGPGRDELSVAFGGITRVSSVTHWPWHSYDFDLASLGAVFPHLRDPRKPFTVGIGDLGPAPDGGGMLTDYGPVTVTWERNERHNGRVAARYRIDGAGLRHRGGYLWVDPAKGTLVDYEIALPDEAGFTSGKLRLEREEPMTPAGWVAFMEASLAGSGPPDFWTHIRPADAGFDSVTLAAFDADLADGRYGLVDGWMLVRQGRIVWASEWRRDYDSVWTALKPADTVMHQFNYDHPDWHPWYRRSRLHTLQSVTKSITSALVGIALARGEIRSLDTPILGYFDTTGLRHLDDRKRAITLRHVLTMSPGIDWNERVPYTDSANSATQMEASSDWVAYVLNRPMSHDPGTHWAYSSGASALLAGILVRATGMSVDDYAREHLFGPLGIRAWYWKRLPTGLHDTEGGLYLATDDLAKIAWLYHEEGRWRGRQLLPETWVAQSFAPSAPTAPDANFRYGFQWWLFADPDRPGSWMPSGSGYGGQFPILLPADSTVLVINQWNIHGRGLGPIDFVRRVRAARR